MKKNKYDIEDDEVYVLGDNNDRKRFPWWVWVLIGVLVTAVAMISIMMLASETRRDTIVFVSNDIDDGHHDGFQLEKVSNDVDVTCTSVIK